MTEPNGILQPGRVAPGFTLPGAQVNLSDSRGRPTVLAFYPAGWSPVCGDQMALYQAALPEFAWSHLSPDEINPGADGILDALEALHSGRAVPA